MSVVTWTESFPPTPSFTEKDIPDQYGRVFIVTGGSSGCGFETAKAIYNLNGRVYIAGRSVGNAEDAIARIKSTPAASHPTVKPGRGSLHFLQLDLNDLSSIKATAEEFLSKEARLDVIWHNAGVMNPPADSVTAQGFEPHLGINALGPFLFQHFLTPLCLKTVSLPSTKHFATRVIFVTSSGYRGSPKPDGVSWDDLNLRTIGGVKGKMFKYGQSKAMDVMFAYEMARRYGTQGLITFSLHPGSLKTGLQRHQPRLLKTITAPLLYEQHYGGLTELFAGFTQDIQDFKLPEQGGKNGSYIQPWGRWREEKSHVYEGLKSRNTGGRLWDMCEDVLKEWIV